MTTISTSASLRLLRLTGLATTLALGASIGLAQTTSAPPSDDGPDPALVNMASPDQTTLHDQSLQAPSSNPQDYLQQAPAPIVRSLPKANASDAAATQPANPEADAQVAAGEAALDDAASDGSQAIYADQAPPPLPDYDQPPAPADDYLWTPGYWAYAPVGYYWVPGVWILPPYYGALWTPGYWGWFGSRFRWHPGYWGLHIGFYGGINYGYGYIGTGYFGGYWNGGHFFYNRSVTNVGVSVTNVYTHNVVYNNHQYGARPVNNISYNGGRGGINATPRPAEVAALHESHTAPLPGQVRLNQTAAQNPQTAFSANRGQISPALAARPTPLGATRNIAPSQAEFHSSPALRQPNPATPTIRAQPEPPRQQPQSRLAPQYRPAPAPRPATAPASHEAKH